MMIWLFSLNLKSQFKTFQFEVGAYDFLIEPFWAGRKLITVKILE